MKIRSESEVLAIYPEGFAVLNRSNGAVISSGTSPTVSVGIEIEGLNLVSLFAPQSAKTFSLAGTLLRNNSTPLAPRDTTKVGNALVAAVGTYERYGSICYTDGDFLSNVNYAFPGMLFRQIGASVPYPDGSIAFVCNEEAIDQNRTVVVKYSAAGALQFSKTIPLSENEPSGAGLLLSRSPDGSLTAVGTGFEGTWFVGRFSATGALLGSGVVPDLDAFFPQQLVALADGTTAVLGTVRNSRIGYRRIDAQGRVINRAIFADASDEMMSIGPAVQVANGSIFLTYSNASGVVRTRLLDIDGSSTAPIERATANDGPTFTHLDPSGRVVIVFRANGQLHLERRNPVTGAIINSRSLAFTRLIRAVDVSPSGNVFVLASGAPAQLVNFGPGAFPGVSSVSLAPEVVAVADVITGPGDVAYVVGSEVVGAATNLYAARYLPSGVRSAQRRIGGTPAAVHVAGNGVWIMGSAGVRRKGNNPFAARYSL